MHLQNVLVSAGLRVREAMRKLELEGLVVMIPRRGAQVANITEKDLNDVLEVRIALENLSIEKHVHVDRGTAGGIVESGQRLRSNYGRG